MAEAVVFDLDGTLIQSEIDYESMRTQAMDIIASAGVPAEALGQSRRIWEIIQGGEKALEEMGLSMEERREALDKLTTAINGIEMKALNTIKLTPNARETLQALREQGIRIGIATRSCNEYAVSCLRKMAIEEFIEALLARDDVEHPKPDPRHLLQVVDALGCSPSRVFYVGDTTTDLKTAEAAGVPFIGFLRNDEWGKRLRESGCEVLINELIKLVDIIDRRRNQ